MEKVQLFMKMVPATQVSLETAHTMAEVLLHMQMEKNGQVNGKMGKMLMVKE